MSRDVAGRFLVDKFYSVSSGDTAEFLAELERICEVEHVNVILPQNTSELANLATVRGSKCAKVAISAPSAIAKANDKYELFCAAKKANVPVPATVQVNSWDGLLDAAHDLGYPDRPVVVKPPVSNGMRGLRILDAQFDEQAAFWNEKPDGVRTTLSYLHHVLGESFRALLVMEYLPSGETTVDVLANEGSPLVVVPRSRDSIKNGISWTATTHQSPQSLIDHSKTLTRLLGLSYAFGFQFKHDVNGEDRLIECNPRVQGGMILSTFSGANIIYGAVKLALGEALPEFKIEWGWRMLRYWGAVKAPCHWLKEKQLAGKA
jgi:carbamoyl-phosphate synthase large subunit